MADRNSARRGRFAQTRARFGACALEVLEDRRLFCGAHGVGQVDLGTYPTVPSSPLIGSSSLSGATTTTLAVSSPLSAVPQLNSLPSAAKKVYLDFVGAAATTWGSYSVPTTPAYDTDGDATTFSDTELANIRAIWARVSEKYSPFNISVTTVDPGSYTSSQTLRVVIGGSGSWLGQSAGGVAYVNSFTSVPSAKNTVWVFPKNLGSGNPKYTAEASAHESGHGFGLQHQSTYSGTTKTNEYNPGNSLVAPIMGNSYSAARGLWWYGTNSVSSTTIQDDMAVVSRSTNGFGYRADDVADTPAAASPLLLSGSSVSGSGVITQTTDVDYFSFSSGAGSISLSGNPAAVGGMLDLKLSLYAPDGSLVSSADSGLGETINATLSSGGTYRLAVASHGSYGDVGQYTISGTIVTDANAVAAPSNLTASVSGTTANVSWSDNSGNETGFTVQKSSDAAFTAATSIALAANSTSYADSTLNAGETWYYRVFASNGASSSDYSNTVTVSVAPAAPATLTASAVSASQVNLAWADVSGESGYTVQRSLDGVSGWTNAGTAAANITTFSATGLSQNTTYYFRVFATNAGGSSLASPTASATTFVSPTPPAAPTGLTATFQSSSFSVALSWNDTATESGYYIERSTNGGKSYSQIGQVGANVTSFIDASVSKRKTYQYRVRGFNAGGTSGYSNIAVVSTSSSAGPVAAPSANAASGNDDDAWDALLL